MPFSKQRQQQIRRENIDIFQKILKHFRENESNYPIPCNFYPSRPQWKGHSRPAKISVLNANCITVAMQMKQKYGRVLMHNMANYSNPGGGVTRGSNAQEEFLCRISNLYPSLVQAKENDMYPLKEGFITSDVSFILGENYEELNMPFVCDVLTLSSPRFDRNTELNARQKSWIHQRMRELLELSIGYDVLVLSAPGCGAFNNPPKLVAEFLKFWLKDKKFQNYFREVVFAIIDDHNSNNNFAEFKKVLDPSDSDQEEDED